MTVSSQRSHREEFTLPASTDVEVSSATVDSAFAGLTPQEIAQLDFSRLVGLVNEPNMPSGGGATVRRVLGLSRPRTGQPILEVGSNTGHTSIEIASWVDAPVIGVDINPVSTAFAAAKAVHYGIANVEFRLGTALDLPFADATFGLVFCSNVTSFLPDHRRARDEYYRVLAPRGVLAAVPIYYRRTPPEALRNRVEEAIGARLPITNRRYWLDLFAGDEATLVANETYEYLRQSPQRIHDYVANVIAQPHLARQPAHLVEAVAARLRYFYELFDENLAYARYDIMLYRRDHPNPEPVLHLSRPVREGAA